MLSTPQRTHVQAGYIDTLCIRSEKYALLATLPRSVEEKRPITHVSVFCMFLGSEKEEPFYQNGGIYFNLTGIAYENKTDVSVVLVLKCDYSTHISNPLEIQSNVSQIVPAFSPPAPSSSPAILAIDERHFCTATVFRQKTTTQYMWCGAQRSHAIRCTIH